VSAVAARARRGRQGGQTLIGMMIGLLISLMTIAAMLAVYKVAVDVSGNASRTAVRDGQLALALLAAQVEMQQAGFGIDPPAAPPAAADTSVLHVSDDGRRVVWRYRPDATGADVCAGVEIQRAASQERPAGVYSLLPSACTGGAGAWTPGQSRLLATEAAFFVPVDRSGAPLAEGGVNLLANAVFRRVDGSAGDGCGLPYAQAAAATSGQRILLRAGSGGASPTLFSVCLPNIAAVAAAAPGGGG